MQAIPSLVGTSCAVAAASSGLVFGQAVSAPDQDRAHTSYVARSSSLGFRSRSPTPAALFRQKRRFSQDLESLSQSNSHLAVPADDTTHLSVGSDTSGPLQPYPYMNKSNQNLKHSPSSSHQQIQHQSSNISSVTTTSSRNNSTSTSTTNVNAATNRPASRRFSISRQLSLRRSPRPQSRSQNDLPTSSQPSSRSQTPAFDLDCRDSVSSTGSWIRKLARRPVSQHGPTRSDSNFSVSQTSSFPFVPRSVSPAPRVPNKLVKRSFFDRDASPSPAPTTSHGRRRAASHLPTFRRPATSHQRSATQKSLSGFSNFSRPKTPLFSLDSTHAPELDIPPPTLSRPRRRDSTRWASFLHSNTVNLRNGSNRLSETANILATPGRRISAATRRVFIGESAANQPACLIKPDQIEEGPFFSQASPSQMFSFEASVPSLLDMASPTDTVFSQPITQSLYIRTADEDQSSAALMMEPQTPSCLSTTSQAPHRRLSLSLASPVSWISRASSIRRAKRSMESSRSRPVSRDEAHSDFSSVPVVIGRRQPHYAVVTLDTIEASILCDSTALDGDNSDNGAETGASTGAAPEQASMSMMVHQEVTEHLYEPDTELESELQIEDIAPSPKSPRMGADRRISVHLRNMSTHLPMHFPSPPAFERARNATMSLQTSSDTAGASSGSRTSSGQSQGFHSRERSSTIASSNLDDGDLISADDDTDFRSDAMFDSVRTHNSVRTRVVDTPLDSIFNDSPISTTALSCRPKRPSILPDPAWDAPSFLRDPHEDNIPTPIGLAPRLQLAARHDYGRRLSIDEDFDDDWGDMDTSLGHGLSPPSVQGSMNMHSLPPAMRKALANGGSMAHADSKAEESSHRPLSNLFDWTEPSIIIESDGEGPRPRTVHGKQDMDTRGGRSLTRRAPIPAHIRSQSVPLGAEQNDNMPAPATTPKFGTWGLGSKMVSEDWGSDFEFGDEMTPMDHATGPDSEIRSSFVMLVPASIQASQPSLKVHSGQIRELSLLVNDLKRLCRHGKELNLTTGPHSALWKEADGIIALASPDENELENGGESAHMDTVSELTDRFMDDSFMSDRFHDADEEYNEEDDEEDEEDDAAFYDDTRSQISVIRDAAPMVLPPRRQSVLMPEDDIFGGNMSTSSSPPRTSYGPNWPLTDSALPTATAAASTSTHDINGAVRSVAAAVHHSTTPDNNGRGLDGKFHFDTTSLKTLVKQASELRDSLAHVLHQADPIAQTSPVRRSIGGGGAGGAGRASGEFGRGARKSPAFTQVFDRPGVERREHEDEESVVGWSDGEAE